MDIHAERLVLAYSCEQLMVVCVSQSTLLRSCDGCSKCGEENDIVRVLLYNVLQPFLYEACHFERPGICNAKVEIEKSW